MKEIISKKDNGRIKIITGLRRSGKSVLLFQLYREWLLGEGVKEDQIIALALDSVVPFSNDSLTTSSIVLPLVTTKY